jgi:hypothetical protein
LGRVLLCPTSDDVGRRDASWWPVAPASWSSWRNHPRSRVSRNIELADG